MYSPKRRIGRSMRCVWARCPVEVREVRPTQRLHKQRLRRLPSGERGPCGGTLRITHSPTTSSSTTTAATAATAAARATPGARLWQREPGRRLPALP
jgi:hypothetical protein